MVFGMDAGDADEEAVVGAGLDGEQVIARLSLREREASTRASGRARADEATTDADPGWTRETLTESLFLSPDSTVSVSLSSPPYASAKRRRGRRAARTQADEATRMGIPVWTRETPTWRRFQSPDTTVSVSSLSPPYECAKRRRERRAARAVEETTDGDPGWTRKALTLTSFLSPDSMVSVSSPSRPYACAKRRRERRAARERTRRRRVGIPDGRGRR